MAERLELQHAGCVCGHRPHRQFPDGSCHCGCSIYEPDLRHEPARQPGSHRVGTRYEWMFVLAETL